MLVTDRSEVAWYALRITYSRELPFKEFLDEHKIENFIPMRYEEVLKNGKSLRKLVPVIHNLIFVRSTRNIIEEIRKTEFSRFPVYCIMDPFTRMPITVPEKQMKHFVAVAGTYNEQIVYLSSSEVPLHKGQKVRIIGGIWEGVEGQYMRIAKDRRVVVVIQGLMVVATAFVHPSLVQVIE